MTEAKACNGKCASCNRKCKANRIDIPLGERTYQARIDRRTDSRNKETGYKAKEKVKYTTKDHDYNYCVRKGYVSEEKDIERLRELPKGKSMTVKAKTVSKDGHQTKASKTKIVRTNSAKHRQAKGKKPIGTQQSIEVYSFTRNPDRTKDTVVWKYSHEPMESMHETRNYYEGNGRSYFYAGGNRFYLDEFDATYSYGRKQESPKDINTYYQDWTCAVPEVHSGTCTKELIDGLVARHPDATVEWIDKKGHHDAEIWWTWSNGEQSGIIHIWDDLSPRKYDTGY